MKAAIVTVASAAEVSSSWRRRPPEVGRTMANTRMRRRGGGQDFLFEQQETDQPEAVRFTLAASTGRTFFHCFAANTLFWSPSYYETLSDEQ